MTIAFGDRHDMAARAVVLGQIDEAIATTYAARTGADAADFATMMDNETWFVGSDGIEAGLADEILNVPENDDDAKALFDLSRFQHVPAALKRQQEDALRAAGFSKRETNAAIATILSESFAVEIIDVGPRHSGRNAEWVEQYHATVEEGIPVLVVLDHSGRLLNDTRVERLDDEDHKYPERIIEFLEKHSPQSVNPH